MNFWLETFKKPKWVAALAFCVFLMGAVLRLWHPGNIEFKYDEQFMFERSIKMGVEEPWPTLGMESGGGVRNPALSLWIFGGLARFEGIFGTVNPVSLARAVQVLNVLALALLGFVVWQLSKKGRARLSEWAFWTLAFCAVNPISIILQRKIWAQSTLPLFSAVLLYSAFLLESPLWAFVFGLIGACIGQIHMSGFFYFGTLLVWAGFKYRKSAKWRHLAAGTLVGSLGMLPWIIYLLQGGAGKSYLIWGFNLINATFFQFWALGALGLNLNYSIGYNGLSRFIHFEHGLALMAAALILGGALLLLSVVGFGAILKNKKVSTLDPEGLKLRSLLRAVFWGLGVVFTVAPFRLFQHYLIVVYPFFGIWIGYLGMVLMDGTSVTRRCSRPLLLVLFLVQWGLSVTLFHFLEANQGFSEADYGIAYQFQTR